jgi:hypothetical protein
VKRPISKIISIEKRGERGWKYGSLEVWKYGNMGVWKYGSMEIPLPALGVKRYALSVELKRAL